MTDDEKAMTDKNFRLYGVTGPWRIRLARLALRLLGVEARVETRHASFPEPGGPKEYPGDDALGKWSDGQAGTSQMFGEFQPGESIRVESRPFLYLRDGKDRRHSRWVRGLSKLPESAWVRTSENSGYLKPEYDFPEDKS